MIGFSFAAIIFSLLCVQLLLAYDFVAVVWDLNAKAAVFQCTNKQVCFAPERHFLGVRSTAVHPDLVPHCMHTSRGLIVTSLVNFWRCS